MQRNTANETGITLINNEGLCQGIASRLSQSVGELHCEPGRIMLERITEFLQQSQHQLGPDERLPMSTEILESSFGLYKQLEGQQSKGGFTTLLPSYGALLKKWESTEIRRKLASVSMKEMQAWTDKNLGMTLHKKRCRTYSRYKSRSTQKF